MRKPIRYAVLVYQAGIANVFAVDRKGNRRRLQQADFRTCESFARGLAAAGVTVRSAACNVAGDIASQAWCDDLVNQPFSDRFCPVAAN